MGKTNCIENGEIVAYVDSAVFSKEIVLKSLYWYGDKFHTSIGSIDNGHFVIKLKPLPEANIPQADLDGYLQKLERDLVDFHLRQTVQEETYSIRELLIAKAFSNGEYEEVPPGNVSDPVGFNPFL